MEKIAAHEGTVTKYPTPLPPTSELQLNGTDAFGAIISKSSKLVPVHLLIKLCRQRVCRVIQGLHGRVERQSGLLSRRHDCVQ